MPLVIKFNILPVVKLLINKGWRASDLKLAEAVIEENKTTILKAWEVFHGRTEWFEDRKSMVRCWIHLYPKEWW